MWKLIVALVFGSLLAPLHADAKPKLKNPIEAVEEEVEKELTDAEKRAEERQKLIEARQSSMAARVVVLQWPETATNYENMVVQGNVKVRIARPDAKFFPEIDLYQQGRKENDASIRARDQRAVVPNTVMAKVRQAVIEIETVQWDELSELDWRLKAEELRQLSEAVWFVDREDLRSPMFQLYVQIGRAAEEGGLESPPWYEEISDYNVNYHWYLAAAMAHDSPELMDLITDETLLASVEYLKDQLDQGNIEQVKLSFENQGVFDAGKFAGEYEVFINGLPVIIENDDALYEVPRGRIDVYLSRVDGGHSLSDTLEVLRLDDKIYGVRDTARKMMGTDLIKQLEEHPNECTPELDDRTLASLAIYSRLHPESEIYVAVPWFGSTTDVRLWRYEPRMAILQLVQDGSGGFPVRFAVLAGGGTIFNGVDDYDPAGDMEGGVNDALDAVEQGATGNPGELPGLDLSSVGADASVFEPKFKLAGIPIFLHMRAHFGRLMLTAGIEGALAVMPDGAEELAEGDVEVTVVDENANPCPEPCWVEAVQSGPYADPYVVDVQYQYGDEVQTVSETLTKSRKWQRLVFAGIGVFMLREAAYGIGPHAWLRFGHYNAPNALDLTAHFGWTEEIPLADRKSPGPNGMTKVGRVRPIVNADLFGGALIPVGDTVYLKDGKATPMYTFGITASAGLTF
jgi:hypothetical protein